MDFYAYDHFIPRSEPTRKDTWVSRLVAFVVRPDQPVQRVELGELAPIEDKISVWRLSVAPREKDQPPADPAYLANAGAALHAMLWEPLAPHLTGVSSVLISPDSPVALLPFGALPGTVKGHHLLADYTFTLAPVPQLLTQTVSRGRLEPPSLLTVGAVDYVASPGSSVPELVSRSAIRGAESTSFEPLPQTGLEVEQITQLFRKVFPAATVQQFTGANATEGTIKPAFSKASLLHLSTHGFVWPELEGSSAPNRNMFFDEQSLATRTGIDPRSRVGLALASANQPIEVDKDDGTLTALEVNSLDLRGVDLVVMSACETALGSSARGEGLLGSHRAFQATGARTIVSSLWQVEDKTTRLLMTRFYENLWKKNMPKAASLREAQLWLLHEGAKVLEPQPSGLIGWWSRLTSKPQTSASAPLSPLFWAAFTLSGDWL